MSGPGEYLPDPTEGVTRVEDLPRPIVQHRNRNKRKCACPKCGYGAYRNKKRTRRLHELGDTIAGRPRDIDLEVGEYICSRCGEIFAADTSDIAPKGSHYTHRVIERAVRSVVEDGLPYRGASWRMPRSARPFGWRDHRVFVPFATIQNWVEAAGKTSARARTG